jgi:hypothetical protein
MALFDIFKNKKPVSDQTESPNPAPKPKKTAKEIATKKGEPYVAILNVELDPDNIGNGAFELDWNDKFITNLVRAGYKGKTDSDMVDLWFRDVCRNVLAENYEQWEANYATVRKTGYEDYGDGKSGIS